MSIIEEYWQGVAQRLQVEADVFNRLILHNGESGRENEASLADVVRRMLPPSVGVGSGIVIDSYGRRSQQSDLIVFDQSISPTLLAQTSQMLFPVETVRMVIEVKTTLDKAEIDDVAKKVASLNQLTWVRKAAGVPFALFAYSCGNAPGTVVEELAALPTENAPTTTCVMRPGIFGRLKPEAKIGLVVLHELDESGSPIPMTWVKPAADNSTAITIGTSSYPVTRTKAYGKQKVVGNPGRALLLFCAEILSLLAEAGAVEAHWLDQYLSATARELIQPDNADL